MDAKNFSNRCKAGHLAKRIAARMRRAKAPSRLSDRQKMMVAKGASGVNPHTFLRAVEAAIPGTGGVNDAVLERAILETRERLIHEEGGR